MPGRETAPGFSYAAAAGWVSAARVGHASPGAERRVTRHPGRARSAGALIGGSLGAAALSPAQKLGPAYAAELRCGGRDYADRAAVYASLDSLHAEHGFTVLIAGGARGADSSRDGKTGITSNLTSTCPWTSYQCACRAWPDRPANRGEYRKGEPRRLTRIEREYGLIRDAEIATAIAAVVPNVLTRIYESDYSGNRN